MSIYQKCILEQVKDTLNNLNIDLSIPDYRQNKNWEELSKYRLITYPHYSYQWITEKYLLQPGQYEKVNSCYAMGTGRDLTEDELSIDKMCYALKYYALECGMQDEVEIKRNITRSDNKDGLIKRFNKLFGCNIDQFTKEQDKLRLLFLLYRFEKKFGSKVLAELLSKPTLENVDNSFVGISNTNGEFIKFLKDELEKEINREFVCCSRNIINNIIIYWMNISKDIMYLLSYQSNDNIQEIIRINNELHAYYEKVLSLRVIQEKKSKRQGLLEFFYLKLLKHEQLCMQLDSINIGNRVLENIIKTNNTSISPEYINKIKHDLLEYKEVNNYLTNNVGEIGYFLWGKRKITGNEKKKILGLKEPLAGFAKMYVDDYFNEDKKIPKLMIIAFLEEYLKHKGKTPLAYKYYRARESKNRTLSASIFDYNNMMMNQFAIKLWLEVALWKYLSYFYDKDTLMKARESISICDTIIKNIISTENNDSMIDEHLKHIIQVKNMVIPLNELNRNRGELNKRLQKVLQGWEFEDIGCIRSFPLTMFYSFSLSDEEANYLTQKIAQIVSSCSDRKGITVIDYDLKLDKSVYGFDTKLCFKLFLQPSHRLISIGFVI